MEVLIDQCGGFKNGATFIYLISRKPMQVFEDGCHPRKFGIFGDISCSGFLNTSELLHIENGQTCEK